MAGGTSTDNFDALSSFQAIRDRAGLMDIVTSISTDELLRERRVELVFENQRWSDLIRFGVADAVLSAHAIEMGIVTILPRPYCYPFRQGKSS